MGMFDTVIFADPIPCEKCGAQIASTQTKQFGQDLGTYRLLTGIYLRQSQAEERLLKVDRADILNHLISHQAEERRLRMLLGSMLSVLSDYVEYMKAEDKPAFLSKPLGGIFHARLKEYLEAPDPLAAIVEHYQNEMGLVERDIFE